MVRFQKQFFPLKLNFIVLSLILIILFLTAAYFYYRFEKTELLEQKQKELQSITQLKIKQISDWYFDEISDAEVISQNTILISTIKKYLSDRENGTEAELTKILADLKKQHNYTDIFITSKRAEKIIATNPAFTKFDKSLKSKIEETVKANAVTPLGFIRSKSLGNKIILGYLASVSDESNRSIAVIGFMIDPEDFIYPLVEYWPLISYSSESFIFRDEGDSVLYLNNLKHRENAPLEFSLPKTLTDLPAVKAAGGYKGIYRGKDYRGVNVIAYVAGIPGTNWFLVSKVDEEELFSGLNTKMILVSIIAFLLLIITWFGLYAIYSYRQTELTNRLHQKDKELWRQHENFKVTMDSLGQGVITLNTDGKILYMNKMAENLTGWELRNARGRELNEVYPVMNEETGTRENNILQKIYKYGIVKELANHTVLLSKNGREIPLMDTGAPVYDADGSIIGISIVFQDETERRAQEKRIKVSEQRIRSTLENLIEGCQIMGFNYEYLYLNNSAVKHSGKKREDLLGKIITECYPGIEKTEMFSKLKSCMETRNHANFENEFTYPDGTKRIFNLRFEPVPEGLFILSEDITDLKSARDFIIKFKTGIELSGDAIFLTDKDGIITYVNPAFEKVFGYTKEEIVGKTPQILKSGTLTREYYENFWNKLLSNKPVNHEIINKTKDNRLIYIEASINPINNESGEIIGYLAIERDVTERKLAEEKREQLTAILDATPDFVAIADSEGKSIFINDAGRKYLGLDPNEDITKITIAESHPEWAKNIVLNEGLPAAAKEGTWIGETALLHRDGHLTSISQIIIAHKSEKGEVKYFSTIGRDITERKEFENELVIAKNKAEEMNIVKTIFFANMSHELRTPFVGILGYADLLYDELENPEHKEMAEGILTTSNRMMETLTKILKLTKLEIHEVEKQTAEVDIEKMILSIYKNFLPAAVKKNISLEKIIKTTVPKFFTDEDLLTDILNNLLNNALNYTDEGKISLIVESKSVNGNKFILFKVTDTGIGIPKDKQDIIWLEFRQGSEGKTRDYQGTGLGLAIVKKYTEILGGTVSLESEEGKGSTFILELPA